MLFRTSLPSVSKINHTIDYHSKVVCLGSCFSENIANKLAQYQFQTVSNPLGILFHPMAIKNILNRAIEYQFFSEKDFFYHNELWQSFDLHSQMSHIKLTNAIETANTSLCSLGDAIRECTHIFITLGTAWVYVLHNEKIVANCHKIRSSYFKKRILSVSEIETAISSAISQIKNINPDAHISLTISPVRHLKDGFSENQRSKAHLIVALHQVIENQNIASYFPSYEILMDELRDYRFYANDMLHPSQTAIDYIWQRFCEAYMNESTILEMKYIDQIRQGLAHRPFNPKASTYANFQEKLLNRIANFQEKYPHLVLDFSISPKT